MAKQYSGKMAPKVLKALAEAFADLNAMDPATFKKELDQTSADGIAALLDHGRYLTAQIEESNSYQHIAMLDSQELVSVESYIVGPHFNSFVHGGQMSVSALTSPEFMHLSGYTLQEFALTVRKHNSDGDDSKIGYGALAA